jgi:release factor glutamine methyltransferase
MSPAPATLGELAREGGTHLATRGVPSPRWDSDLLLAHALGIDRSALVARLGEEAPAGVREIFLRLIERRGRRIPLQHLTGRQEFRSLVFRVDGRVLIPRPETELVVEEAVLLAGSAAPRIADIGTGSGAIAVAAAVELPAARVWATDLSAAALEVARENAARHGVAGRIAFLQGELAAPLEGSVEPSSLDLVLSNPPYVGAAELAALEPEVRDHEPRVALCPGEDPLAVYPALAAAADRFLRPGGHLVAELPADGADRAAAILRRVEGLCLVGVRNDLSGIPRVLCARRK